MLDGDLQFFQSQGTELALRTLAALVCGVLLGYERQRRAKPVGLLTAILVAMGSMIFAGAGVLLAREAGLPADPTRMASMIVTGIGFIGGGTIMRSRFNVSGLASAATIWCLGGLGLLAGTGHPLLAVSLAVALAALLRMVPALEHYIFAQRFCIHADIEVDPEASEDVVDFLLENQIVVSRSATREEDGAVVLRVDQCGLETGPSLMIALRNHKGVRAVRTERA